MNHQPFRDWMLSEDKLPAAQEQMLAEHVNNCASCQQLRQSWLEAETMLIKAPLVLPQPGFSTRWQTHLAQDLQRRQTRRSIFSIGLICLLSLGFLTLLGYQLWVLIQTPGPYLAFWFNQLVSLLSVFFLAQHLVSPFPAVTPIVAFFSIIFLTGLASFVSVLWLAAYRKLSLARRVA